MGKGIEMTDITALIARLEAADGPSNAIDVDIFRIIGLTEAQESHCRKWCKMDGRTDLTRDHYIVAWAPDFTRSIDAALTLVPDGWSLWRIDQYHDDKNPAWGWGVTLRRHVQPDFGVSVGESRISMPIAICIAALKARANG